MLAVAGVKEIMPIFSSFHGRERNIS